LIGRQAGNTNVESRNPKQIQKGQKGQIQNPKLTQQPGRGFQRLGFGCFELWICFGFGASDFGFWNS
jgi:hypothetical protein